MAISTWVILAQAGGAAWSWTFTWLAIILLFFFMILRPQQKERSKRERMLTGLKKNDRVVTIGGIYGVVTNVQRESDEVTLRIDEATNTKIRVTVSAVGRVLEEGDAEAGKDA